MFQIMNITVVTVHDPLLTTGCPTKHATLCSFQFLSFLCTKIKNKGIFSKPSSCSIGIYRKFSCRLNVARYSLNSARGL